MHLADSAIRFPAASKTKTGSVVSWGMVLLLIYAAVSIGRIQELLPFLTPMRPGLIAGGLALLVWIKAPGTWTEKIPLELPEVKSVMMLLAIAVVTIPISVWPGNSVNFLLNVYSKTILLFLLVIYWCRSLTDVHRLLWVCCLATAALVIPGILSGDHTDRYQAESVSYDPNDLAFLFVIALPFVLYLFSVSSKRAKFVLIGIALLCLYGIVLTQSRGGLLSLVVVGVLILWRSRLSRSAKIGTVLTAVLVFGVLAGTAWKERIATIWDPQTEYDQTAGGRTDIWKTGLRLLATHPWGLGIDGFVTAEGLSHSGAGKWSSSHNSFVQIATELGIVGLIVFIRLLKQVMRTLRHVETLARGHSEPTPAIQAVRRFSIRPDTPQAKENSKEIFQLAQTLEIALWGFIVGGFFLSQAYGGILYVILALSLVCIRLVRQQTGESGYISVGKPLSFAARFPLQRLRRR